MRWRPCHFVYSPGKHLVELGLADTLEAIKSLKVKCTMCTNLTVKELPVRWSMEWVVVVVEGTHS